MLPQRQRALPAPALWWRLARPFSLTASAAPVLVGCSVAFTDGTLRRADLAAAMLVASLLIQVATNMFNEFYDYRRGLDTPGTVGIAGAIVTGAVAPRVVFMGGALCFLIAFGLGMYLVFSAGLVVFWLGVASALAGFVYTGGPWPIAYTPLGEIEVFVFMGPVIVGLAYYIQAGTFSPGAQWASIPIGCLVAAILLANNLRDVAADAAKGRRTLPIILGRRASRLIYALLVAAAPAAVLIAVLTRGLPPTALVALLAAPFAVPILRLLRATDDPTRLNGAVRGSAALHARFGLLLALGISAVRFR